MMRNAIPLLLSVLAVACSAEGLSLPPSKSVREEVYDSYRRNPEAANLHYRSYFSAPLSTTTRDVSIRILACAKASEGRTTLSPSCASEITEGLRSSSVDIRSNAVAALAFMREGDSVPALVSALKDPADEVHLDAVAALEYRLSSALSADTVETEKILAGTAPFCAEFHDLTPSSKALCDRLLPYRR